MQVNVALRPLYPHIQHGIPRLHNPGIHNLGDRLPRNLPQRVPQIRPHRVGVLMPIQVFVQPLPESVRPQKALQHPQHGRALAVAYGVKQLPYLGRIMHLLLYRMRISQPVKAQRPVGIA